MLWVYIVGVACVVNVKVNKVLCPVEALVSRVLGEDFRSWRLHFLPCEGAV